MDGWATGRLTVLLGKLCQDRVIKKIRFGRQLEVIGRIYHIWKEQCSFVDD